MSKFGTNFLLITLCLSFFIGQPLHGMNGMNGDRKKGHGWLRSTISGFVSDISSGLTDGITGEGLNARRAAEQVDHFLTELVVEIPNQLRKGPGLKALNKMLVENRNYVIKWAALSSLFACSLMAMTVIATSGTAKACEVIGDYISMHMKRPRLIIGSGKAKGRISKSLDFIFRRKTAEVEVIFSPETQEQVDALIKQTKKISSCIAKGKNVTRRNVLLWGPPGTGKTLLARKIAREGGLNWVEITGSSLFQPGAGVNAIDHLMSSLNNAVLFIDEADSLFASRDTMDPTSDNYKIANHMLNYLGTKTSKFMVIMTTNNKFNFDAAMRRRIHDIIELPNPGLEERVRLFDLYAKRSLFDEKQYGKAFATSAQSSLPADKIHAIAAQTDGFSSDEVATLVETICSLASISEEELVTPALVDKAVKQQVESRKNFAQRDTPVPVVAAA